MAAVVIGDIIYMEVGTLFLKGTLSCGFVSIGVVNLIYALQSKSPMRYPLILTIGLFFAMLGDIVLGLTFIPGVVLFALGHVFYCIAFAGLCPLSRWEVIFSAAFFALAVGIIKFLPVLDFGSSLLENICLVYGLIISCMVGKSLGNYRVEHTRANLIAAVGSLMFYFSDVMLVLAWFGNGPRLTDILCLITYYPGQCLLAHGMYHYVIKELRG